MPTIQAFHGLRYDLGHVGSLSDVVTPPYDVISPEFQDELYKKHPANFIRLELNREEPGDNDGSNKYSRAARFLRNWRSEGVMQLDPDPAVYVYHQTFEAAGQTFTRRGFMCRVRLERFGQGKIYPHEETHSGPKADRLLLTKACKANLSQIFGLYPDPANAAQNLLEDAVAGQTPLTATDHLGVVHRMWPVANMRTISEVAAIMDAKPMFIADGHHRYETACNYRDELAAAGQLDVNHPANFVLTQCVSMNDPGLLVLPTHRLFRGVQPITSVELAAKLQGNFITRPIGVGPELATALWQEIASTGLQNKLAFYTAQDDTWTLALATEAGSQQMAKLASEHSTDWQGLGVSILHRLVMENLLGLKELPKPMYVHSVQEVIDNLKSGDRAGRDATGQMGTGGRFELAALVMPATVDHVRLISEHGERMPAKSTYFYPKLLGGMVVHPLE
ncbi:DUF1015 domain-containing protein [Anatilimnocola floriformis]|uniref:DUF1015 domain-containing protein n=1 Tax=Anatilimnocola floriformis TaxID=2948575 RepID=UPI0020C26FAB|nr:DUF1015 domain-containing protein [Anatilimnocola floriformis]